MRKQLHAGVWAAALAALAATSFEVAPAAAQFICVGNATGTAVPPETADGAGAKASGSDRNVACGPNANASGSTSNNTAIGKEADASGAFDDNTAIGAFSNASGGSNTATGVASNASGDGGRNTASGAQADASGNSGKNVAIGNSSKAKGFDSGNIASGFASDASGDSSSNVAIGDRAFAAGDGGARTAVGAGARAEGANSSAFGAGAVATRDNQIAFGTKDNTYTMGGITSAASRAAQSGPVELVTTDAFGNLASDGGAIQRQINSLGQRDKELADGIAISLALAQPMFQTGQNVAMRLGWGNFDGSNAIGFTAAGVLNRGWNGTGSSIVVDAGIGVGTAEGVMAGRAGLSFGW